MSDARAYAQRNQRGSDWFCHDDNTTSAPAPKAAPPPVAVEPKSDDGAKASRTQMIKPKCDSNQWFMHEHTAGSQAPAPTVAVTAPVAAPVAVAAPAASEPAAAAAAPQPDVKATTATPPAAAPTPAPATTADNSQASREGDDNSRRDKAGSSASWFSHDHRGEASVAQVPRVLTKEGGANASRMRGESENWFNYEAGKGQQDIHVGKARSSRTQTDSMSQIFNTGK